MQRAGAATVTGVPTGDPAGAQLALLRRIADALDRLAPPALSTPDLAGAWCHIWRSGQRRLAPVDRPDVVRGDLLIGLADAAEALRANTSAFAHGFAAQNALLWGVRGVGKSALAKAIVAEVAAQQPTLRLVEVRREDLKDLAQIMEAVAGAPWQVIVFVDDLSFTPGDETPRALRPVLEGGVCGRPANVILYATSNRRHITERDASHVETRDRFVAEGEEEQIALADRFGLRIGFHPMDQETYLAVVAAYADAAGLDDPGERLAMEARLFALEQGGRSGRVARRFVEAKAAACGRTTRFGAD
jgi:predicted AAA+ superfamily ATPase